MKNVCRVIIAFAVLVMLALPVMAASDFYDVTGGKICSLGTDAMGEARPAPDGHIACYNDQNGDGKYSMLLDIGSKPAEAVCSILLQNTTEYKTWRCLGKINVLVSSREDEAAFDPKDTSLYDTVVLSGGTVLPTASTDPWNQDGIQAGLWRTAALTTPVAKRFFLIEVTDCVDGPISNPATSYFFLGDVNYAFAEPLPPIDGFDVTGGRNRALNTDAMTENRPAPDGHIACYNDRNGDGKYSMLFDLLDKPADEVEAILLQNTTEYKTWRCLGRVNILVSSHEDEPGFDPTNASLYDTVVLSGGTVLPTASKDPLNQDGIQAGLWRTATLTTPVAKRFFLIEVTDCVDGPISDPATDYFFLGDVNYTTELPPPPPINGIDVTGGKICPLNADVMGETRPAPNGHISCYSLQDSDGKYTMLFDLLDKPADEVEAILLQNTTEYAPGGTNWTPVNIDILVSSHEDQPGSDPTNVSLYDTVVLSNGTVTPVTPVSGTWRTAVLTTPVAKRFFLIEVTSVIVGPISNPSTSYFFLGDVNYTLDLPEPPASPKIQTVTDPIAVDAYFSDWADAVWIPMDVTYDGNDAELDADIPDGFSCYAARWNQTLNKIYVAVKIKDMHHKFLDSYTEWNARDAIELYLHTTAASPVNFFTAEPPYTSAQCYVTGVNTTGGTWYSMSDQDEVPAHAGFQAAAREDGEWLYYEFAMTPFDYFDLAGGNNTITQLKAGDKVGLDVVAVGHNGTKYVGTKGIHNRRGLYDNWTLFSEHVIEGSGGGPTLPVVGTTNKAVLDAIMDTAAPNYIWVLWGKVTTIDSDSFTIDDGSGVNIEVSAPGYADLGVEDGSFVSVRGTFDADTKILTSQDITKHD